LQHTRTHCTRQHANLCACCCSILGKTNGFVTHCNTPQHTATHRTTPQHTAVQLWNTLQHTTTHCNTLQYVLYRVAVYYCCNSASTKAEEVSLMNESCRVQCTAVRYSVLQCGAACCSVLQCVAVCSSVLQLSIRKPHRLSLS